MVLRIGGSVVKLRVGNMPRQSTFAEWVLYLAIALIPFQQALTIDIGFPLKMSELLAIAGVISYVIERRFRILQSRLEWPIIVMAAIVVASSVYAAATTNGGARPEGYPQGLLFDLAQYTGYALLAMSFALALGAVLTPESFSSAIGWAVRLAFIYAAVQIIVWAVGGSFVELVNGNFQLGSQYGVRIPRNGSFREGNYLGFFAATSLFFLVRARDLVGGALAVLLVFYSQSTGAMVGIIAAIVVSVLLRPSRRKLIVLSSAIVVSAIIAVVVPAVNRLVTGQLTKLGLIENNLGPSYGYSLRSRSVNAETGFQMAFSNPILGVGQGRYSLYFDEYIDRTGLPDNLDATNVRHIANNAYAQIAAETGLIALAAFAVLLCALLYSVRKFSASLVAVVVALGVGLVAFPAWTNVTAWAVIGGLMSHVHHTRTQAPDIAGSRRALRQTLSARETYISLFPVGTGR